MCEVCKADQKCGHAWAQCMASRGSAERDRALVPGEGAGAPGPGVSALTVARSLDDTADPLAAHRRGLSDAGFVEGQNNASPTPWTRVGRRADRRPPGQGPRRGHPGGNLPIVVRRKEEDRHDLATPARDEKHVRAPALVRGGGLDLAQVRLPNRERITIPGASHTVPGENPRGYDEAVLAFLAKHRSA